MRKPTIGTLVSEGGRRTTFTPSELKFRSTSWMHSESPCSEAINLNEVNQCFVAHSVVSAACTKQVSKHVCMPVCVYTYTYMHVSTAAGGHAAHVDAHAHVPVQFVYVCTSVPVNVYKYMNIYIYIYTYIHTYIRM